MGCVKYTSPIQVNDLFLTVLYRQPQYVPVTFSWRERYGTSTYCWTSSSSSFVMIRPRSQVTMRRTVQRVQHLITRGQHGKHLTFAFFTVNDRHHNKGTYPLNLRRPVSLSGKFLRGGTVSKKFKTNMLIYYNRLGFMAKSNLSKLFKRFACKPKPKYWIGLVKIILLTVT